MYVATWGSEHDAVRSCRGCYGGKVMVSAVLVKESTHLFPVEYHMDSNYCSTSYVNFMQPQSATLAPALCVPEKDKAHLCLLLYCVQLTGMHILAQIALQLYCNIRKTHNTRYRRL